MISSRIATRSFHALRAVPRTGAVRATPVRTSARHVRFQTTNVSASSSNTSPFIAGIAGGAVVFVLGYGYYYFSGAKSIVNVASQSKKQYNKIVNTMKDQAPDPNDALKWFRDIMTTYAAFVPGGKQMVDALFKDLDKIEQNHRGELDKIVGNAYSDLQSAAKGGLTPETAQKVWEIAAKYAEQIADLASDSAGEILDNHPQIKEKISPHLDQLRNYAKQYGPEAKQQLDQTYDQIKGVLAAGISVDTASKVQKIIQEKLEKVKEIGEQAWKKGMEEVKPYLDKNPEIKKAVEENADALKQGNFSELYEKIKSGDLNQLKDFAQQQSQKVMGSSAGKSLQEYAKYIPGGDKILPKLGKLQEVAQKRGDEAQRILKETYDEVAEVLAKKTKEVEELKEEVKKDGKKAAR